MVDIADAQIIPAGATSAHKRPMNEVARLALRHFPFVFDTAVQSQSMLHYKPGAVGEVISCSAFKPMAAPPYSGSVWEVYALSGMAGGPNNSTFVTGVGFILDGVHARFRLIIDGQTDFWAAGVQCDGVATGQITRLNRLIQASQLVNGRLMACGTLIVDQTINVEDTFLDIPNLKMVGAVGFNGPMMRLTGPDRITDAFEFKGHCHGTPDGSWGVTDIGGGALAWNNINLDSVAFEIDGDNSGNSFYHLHASYAGIGARIQGDTEKADIHVFAVGCDQAVQELRTSGGTTDTNRIRISGTRCRRLHTSGDDNTGLVDFNFESAVDLGLNITLSDGTVVPDPRVLVKNGKSSSYSGELRASNGRLFFLIDRDGSNAAHGSDACHFNNLRFQDNVYGTLLWARKCQKLTGRLYGRHVHNGRQNVNEGGSAGVGSIPCPSVRIDQVYQGDFSVVLTDCGNREGLRIGDAAANSGAGLYPRDWTMGRSVIVMRGFNALNATYPTTYNAVVIEKMLRGGLQFDQIEGNIELLEGCQGVRIEVPEVWARRYKLTAHASATATIVLRGPIASSDIFFKSWLRAGIDVVVESLTDYGGAPARYTNGKWIIAGWSHLATADQLASISSDLNQRFKRQGVLADDGTRIWRADGPDADDPWTHYDGTNANTVGYMAATTALIARMATDPGVARKNIYDRLYFDLDEAGLTADLVLLYILGAHEQETALLNLFDADYDLTIAGAPIFTVDRGFTGTGVATDYLDTGFDATVAAEGIGQNDSHLGVFALSNSSVGGMMGSANGRMKVRVASGGSSLIGVNTTSNPGWTTTQSLPRHVVGSRLSSGNHIGYDNGVQAVDSANGSTGLPDLVSILKTSAGATAGEIFAAHLGKGLAPEKVAALNLILRRAQQSIVT